MKNLPFLFKFSLFLSYYPGPGVFSCDLGSYIFEGFIFGHMQLEMVDKLYIPVAEIVDMLLSKLQ
jgi:hypothetical protein